MLPFFLDEFIAIDTEGRDFIREIAAFDRGGNLIYQAWVAEYADDLRSRRYTKSLSQVLAEFFQIAKHQTIVCHNAKHEDEILKRSCQVAKLDYPPLKFICTVELARSMFPDLRSYSLEYLSKKLQVKIKGKIFEPRQAHSAKYDAEFTCYLYQKILGMHSSNSQSAPNIEPKLLTLSQEKSDRLKDRPNPFINSRVDTPFQDHPDRQQIYQREFEQLKIAIGEIDRDKNRQSLGAVVIGAPGAGKTHLMMRLAKELLRVNRLLFIRHPNNPDAILYHIYSRILESLIQKVPETNFTQLEHLIAHSFRTLITNSPDLKLTQIDRDILAAVQSSPLNIYTMGATGTERRRKLWGHIEKRLLDWWVEQYGFSGYAIQIIKGLIRFCYYSDRNYKSILQRWLAANSLNSEDLQKICLDDWHEDLSKEEFSLEAISVFSKLSFLDEPLLIVFDQLESLGLPNNHRLLENFGEAVKEIFTHVPNSLIILNLFPDRWQHFQQVLNPAVIDRLGSRSDLLERKN
jgi:DNA polymerase III epsilon subunit-like protein